MTAIQMEARARLGGWLGRVALRASVCGRGGFGGLKFLFMPNPLRTDMGRYMRWRISLLLMILCGRVSAQKETDLDRRPDLVTDRPGFTEPTRR